MLSNKLFLHTEKYVCRFIVIFARFGSYSVLPVRNCTAPVAARFALLVSSV